MKFSELDKLLKAKNISLKDFNVSYIVPTINFKGQKEIVEEFEIKFEGEK